MSLPSEVMSQVENMYESSPRATEKQAMEIARFMASNRGLTRGIFPDRMVGEVNMWRSDCESWTMSQDRRTISDIIGMLHNDEIDMALNQLKHLR